jgi:hypothetical protein
MPRGGERGRERPESVPVIMTRRRLHPKELILMIGRSLLAVIAGLTLVSSGGRGEPDAVDILPDAAPPGEDGANLDWAVDTARGPWCTTPREIPRLTRWPLTVEGWFRPRGGGGPAVLLEVGDAEGGRSWTRLALDAQGNLRDRASGGATVTARLGVWTHYALALRAGESILTTWDAERGERQFAMTVLPAAGLASEPVQVCIGGRASGEERLDGHADEIRIWSADLGAAEVRHWRHRRLTEAHPRRAALLGYWPFRTGRGSSEPDLAAVGPVQAGTPAWMALPRLDYGPVLRAVERRSARFLFHARDATGAEGEWAAGLEIGTSDELRAADTVTTPSSPARAADDYVAHLRRDDLEPQTRYYYAPLIDGRRGLDPGPGGFPSLLTLPDLGGRNADFTAAFFADQHVHGATPVPLGPYDAAAASRPMFWAQLGDVAAGNLDGRGPEHRRTAAQLQAVWARGFAPGTPQAAFAGRFGLNLATISDHEVTDNFSLNWHLAAYGQAASAAEATLHDRVGQYDRSLARWWASFGWGDAFDDRLGQVARTDRGESVMAETPVAASAEAGQARVCLDRRGVEAFAAGDFVSLADASPDVLHTRVRAAGADSGCTSGWSVTLAQPPARPYQAEDGSTLAVGARYARPGHYRAWQPFPFVEFFVADTTSYRGDTYQKQSLYAVDANRDRDHARYRWDPVTGPEFIYADRAHGANRTTDGVRSWLGPTQRNALLAALAGSRAAVVVVAAGYPLYSVKFEGSTRYWEARESGFDFAPEVEQIVTALERLDRLVLWIHGDGHTPALVRLRRNVYQLQTGATHPSSDRPGHRSRRLVSGSRSGHDTIGGGYLIAGHQPDLSVGDESNDIFEGGLDQFAGYLRLYFHPGQEGLRSSESAGLRRGRSAREVIIPAARDPALGEAARLLPGKVVRLRFGDDSLHSVVAGYRYEPGQAVVTLQDPVVRADPDELRVLLDALPWVESRWFDARGREWRDFTFVMRKDL